MSNVSFDRPGQIEDHYAMVLSGLTGIHENLDEPSLNLVVSIKRLSESVLIRIESRDIRELIVKIDPINNLIYNESFVKRGGRKGLAASWVKSQVAFAHLFSFKILQGWCEKGNYKGINWCGFVIWAKLGYLMDEKSKTRFEHLLARHGRRAASISELLQRADGLNFWIAEGEGWFGEFDLRPGSESRRILEGYRPSGN